MLSGRNADHCIRYRMSANGTTSRTRLFTRANNPGTGKIEHITENHKKPRIALTICYFLTIFNRKASLQAWRRPEKPKEPKRTPPLIKSLNIATYNVRTLNGSGKQHQLTAGCNKYDIKLQNIVKYWKTWTNKDGTGGSSASCFSILFFSSWAYDNCLTISASSLQVLWNALLFRRRNLALARSHSSCMLMVFPDTHAGTLIDPTNFIDHGFVWKLFESTFKWYIIIHSYWDKIPVYLWVRRGTVSTRNTIFSEFFYLWANIKDRLISSPNFIRKWFD